MWFRRDLRLADNPALLTAASAGGQDGVVPLFVFDPALYGPAGAPRRAYLVRSLAALARSTGGCLVVRSGDPAEVVPAVARAVGAGSVHLAEDVGPYGRQRDARVEAALHHDGRALQRTGSPYAVSPGRVRKGDGTPFRVFTPFSRAWAAHGWRAPAGDGSGVRFVRPEEALPEDLPEEPDLGATTIPEAGEAAARQRWDDFRAAYLAAYRDDRDRPDRPGTSRLSVSLKYGEIHPRTLLADLAVLADLAALAERSGTGPEGVETFRTELCWRDFYADVVAQDPASAREPLDAAVGAIATRSGPDADAAFQAWAEGRTGFPAVDAAMRQLRAEAWVHNRMRMVVASFLVKDLHLPWQRGARLFMRRLVDGDLPSNQHGWQWVAGTGTDAAPFFRIFNPVLQGKTFDPDGEYVRRYVPELRGIPGGAVHEPWRLPAGPPAGYPARIVDHGAERKEALRRYEEVRR